MTATKNIMKDIRENNNCFQTKSQCKSQAKMLQYFFARRYIDI